MSTFLVAAAILTLGRPSPLFGQAATPNPREIALNSEDALSAYAQLALQQAAEAQRAGRSDEAIRLFRLAADRYQSVLAYLELARMQSRRGDPTAAPASLSKARAARQTEAQAAPTPGSRLWSVSASASNVFESNIDRSREGQLADGLVLGLTGYVQNRADRPTLTVQYQVGLHTYAGTDRWDRLSHNVRASYERRLAKSLSVEGVSEIAIKGSSEDRELGNQYVFSPRLQYRFSRAFRVGFEGGYRVRRYDDPLRNATNPYGGLRLSWRFGGRGRLDAGYRYEENHATGERHRYRRYTVGSEVLIPVTPHDTFDVEAKWRTRRYERLVRVDGARVPLRDAKWTLSPAWVHLLSPGLQLRLSYEFETRGANDPDRQYDAHSTVFAIERRW